MIIDEAACRVKRRIRGQRSRSYNKEEDAGARGVFGEGGLI